MAMYGLETETKHPEGLFEALSFLDFRKNEKKLGGIYYCFLAKNGHFLPKNSNKLRLTFFSFFRKSKNDRLSKSPSRCLVSLSRPYWTISDISHMTLNFFSKKLIFVIFRPKSAYAAFGEAKWREIVRYGHMAFLSV